MQIVKTGQDYSGALRPPVSSVRGEAGGRSAAADAAANSRPGAAPPVERVVEGEWLKGRTGTANDFFERIWRHRSSEAGNASSRESASPYETQRAINAYLAQATQFERPASAAVSTVDYYA